MDPLTDTQSEKDTRQTAIDRVGVKRLRYPVQVERSDGSTFGTAAEFSLYASLAPSVKGTHMSRFVQALHESGTVLSADSVIALARDIRTRLKAESAGVDVSMPWFLLKPAPVSGIPGMLDCTVRWTAEVTARRVRLITEVAVPVGTLCPCSKAISDRGAHNQRGMVTISAESASPLAPEILIDIAESSGSCALFSVLKRPDEKFVTERAYDNPVFVEDVVRNAAILLRKRRTIRAWRVSAENFESIHSHNAWAEICSVS